MRFSELSPEERGVLLQEADNFPLRVTFLGKIGLLTREELDLLQAHGVDFDVDDHQVAEILRYGAGTK